MAMIVKKRLMLVNVENIAVKDEPKTNKKEYQREFQQVRRIIKKASPEIQKLLKEPEGEA